jgi:hypothetical protein
MQRWERTHINSPPSIHSLRFKSRGLPVSPASPLLSFTTRTRRPSLRPRWSSLAAPESPNPKTLTREPPRRLLQVSPPNLQRMARQAVTATALLSPRRTKLQNQRVRPLLRLRPLPRSPGSPSSSIPCMAISTRVRNYCLFVIQGLADRCS